ncbi:MAG: Uma2 family endonuclease [Chthonomonadaceae bacterium]|nr:Uma2 family endonuclease [Chthonomonadaceae bacterium]
MSAEQIVAYPSPEEYLIRERKAKHRSEYENGEMIVMAGASYEHNLIVTNLSGELRLRLKKSPCTPLSQDMRVAISYRKYYYPDVVIVCDKPEFVDNQLDTLLNPIVVVEVLSPSTENRDRKTKLRSYRAVETIQEIVFVSQELPLLEVYRRGVTGWTLHDYEGLDAVLTLSSVNCEVPLSEIYDRMDFDLPPKNA